MSVQGQPLEINVVGCKDLRDTEWISRQDPYVVLEYASTKFRTKTDTDGGRNPSFDEKFILSVIEGLREINVNVWNSNTISFDDFIGAGKIQLHKVLSSGYDDCSWPLSTRSGKRAGQIRVIMHFANAKNHQDEVSSTPTYTVSPYQGVPPGAPLYYTSPSYHAPPSQYHTPSSSYPASSGYPPMLPSLYPPAGPGNYGPLSSGYPPPQPPPYPQPPYGTYPPLAYPPPPGYGAPPSGAYPHPGYRGYGY